MKISVLLVSIIVIQFGVIIKLYLGGGEQKLEYSRKVIESIRNEACNSKMNIYSQDSHCHNFPYPNQNSCRIVTGFAGLIDYEVYLKELIPHLSPPSQAKYHAVVNTMEEFKELLAYKISQGAAGEYRVPQNVFSELKQLVEGLNHNKSIGGNSIMIGMRAAIEGCQVANVTPLSKDAQPMLAHRVNNIIPWKDEGDIHLCILFTEGDAWGDFRVFRSNRLYINHDVLNVQESMFDFMTEKLIKENDIVVLGGIQLYQNLPNELQLLKKLGDINELAHKLGKKTHLELGDFQKDDFYSEAVKLVQKVDSLGLNEQETAKLLSFIKNDPFITYPSKSQLSEVINITNLVLSEFKQKQYNLNRIHVHYISGQIICSDNQWQSPRIASARSALLATQLTCDSSDIQLSKVLIHHQTIKFHDVNGEQIIEVSDQKTAHCWQPYQDWQCCLALTPTCMDVVTTKSLGDNISGMGLAFHRLAQNQLRPIS